MSIDFPFYEELRRRKHRAAWWWRVGDSLYYVGLLGGTLSFVGLLGGSVAGLLGLGWHWVALSVVGAVVCPLLFLAGVRLTRYAYRLAERDGIRPDYEPCEPAASALRLISSLTGDRIARVIYREIRYDHGQPGYRESDHHSLDYGLELHLESDRVVSFIWKWPVAHHLAVIAADLLAEISGEHATWDVSAEPPWPKLLGREIRAAHLDWFGVDGTDGAFPLTAKLVIDSNTSLYITLGVGREADDHVAVLFSDDVARVHGRFVAASGARLQY